MKRQLLSAVLTGTLTGSCAAAFVAPAPEPFACQVIEIGQGSEQRLAAKGAAQAGYNLILAIKADDMTRYVEASNACRQITGALRSFGEDAYEMAFAKTEVEFWEKFKDADEGALIRAAKEGQTNFFTRMKWRLIDAKEKSKREVPLPDESQLLRKRSQLRASRGFDALIRQASFAYRQIAENCAAEFSRVANGQKARAILILWSEYPDSWYYVGKGNRETKSYQLRQIEQRLGLTPKQAGRGLDALLLILQKNLSKDLMS